MLKQKNAECKMQSAELKVDSLSLYLFKYGLKLKLYSTDAIQTRNRAFIIDSVCGLLSILFADKNYKCSG